mmetsp:Transcript_6863/g.17565  ORF Transcript_6863/g.17565 Transcript_6863/m.17565 type:complete len:212 (-) Transcript_6863:396-1031(-)
MAQQQTYEVVVPAGVQPGKEFAFQGVHGRAIRVRCPESARPGTKFYVKETTGTQVQRPPVGTAFTATAAAAAQLPLVNGAPFPSHWRMPPAQMAPTMFGQNPPPTHWLRQYNNWLEARQRELQRQRQNYMEGVQENMQQLQEWQTEQYKQYQDLVSQLGESGLFSWPGGVGQPGCSGIFGQADCSWVYGQADWSQLLGCGMVGMGDFSWFL